MNLKALVMPAALLIMLSIWLAPFAARRRDGGCRFVESQERGGIQRLYLRDEPR